MNKILLVLNSPTQNEAAVARLLELADASTVVELLTIVHEPNLDGYLGNAEIYAPLRKRLIDEEAEKAAKIELTLKDRGIDVSSKAVWDWPRGDAIRREAFAFGADGIILSFGIDGGRHIGSRDWRFLAECPLPILVVNGPAKAPYAQLVAAVDPVHAHAKPADLDDAIVRAAAELGRRAGAKLQLAHFYVPLSHYGARADENDRVPLNDAEQALEQSRRQALGRLVAIAGLDPAEPWLIEGDPVSGLKQLVADDRADLVVMGALSRGKLADLIIGSTAERILRWAGCDVLFVKPLGAAS
jgi:universal stress protein E